MDILEQLIELLISSMHKHTFRDLEMLVSDTRYGNKKLVTTGR